MDPNAVLAEIRTLYLRYVAYRTDADSQALDVADDLAERVEALDAWIVTGGFLPDSWNRATE